MPVHKPGASGRERIPNQGCKHVPSTCRSSWKLASHHVLRHTTAFQGCSLLSKALRSRCMTSGGSASPRFRLMTSPPIRVSLPCDIGLFLASRSSLRSWRLSLQKALQALTTQAQPSPTIADGMQTVVLYFARCGEPGAPCFDLTDVLSRSYRSREVAATINNSDEQVGGMTHRTRGIAGHGSSGRESALE
jgi:hypothetical protein